MRVLICSLLTGCMLAVTYTAVTWQRSEGHAEQAVFNAASDARRAIEREIRIRAATGDATLNERGWPDTIVPDWFGRKVPRNPFVGADHPWLEVATDADANLIDPPIRQALTRDVAGFWYNPNNGVLRARVGPRVTDADAIDLYNRLNAANVATLFAPAEATEATNVVLPSKSPFLKTNGTPKITIQASAKNPAKQADSGHAPKR
jgi:hypothetical protein